MVRLAVIRLAGEWRIICPQARLDGFATRELALSAGTRLARQLRETGQEVELLVQDSVGVLTPHSLEEPRRPAAILNSEARFRI